MFVVFNLVPSTSASDSSTESTLRSILRPHVHLQTPYHRPHQETQPPRSRPINVPLREAHEAAGKYITTQYIHIIEILRGQPIKFIQVVSASEFHEY